MVLPNRIAGPSAGRRTSSKGKGKSRRKAPSTGTTKRGHGGGARARKGWSGPAPAKQVRGSNTTTSGKRPSEPRKEDAKGKVGRSRAQATPKGPDQSAPKAKAGPGAVKGAIARTDKEEPQDGPRTYEVTMDDALHGPERMEAFKSKADEMVVGERTVIHHAARYGIVRGMTWTVILSALLFWLPVVGPAIAGYVGGRKAGGPLRGVIAVLIPAMVMFIMLAAVTENMDLMPTGMVSDVSFDPETLADLPAQAVPLLGGLQRSVDAWMAAPPDVMFIMLVFALVGGALSSLRRREEETVIEKVGIPLGELKERVLKEEAERAGMPFGDPPSRWHPHPAIAAPVAAHDAFNELVEEVAQKVYMYMQGIEPEPGTDGFRPAARRSRRGRQPQVSTGGEGPHYDQMVSVVSPDRMAAAAASAPAAAPAPSRRGRRSRRGASAATGTTSPRTVAEAIVGGAEDWEVVDTSKGRRPIRVVRSPRQEAPVMMPEHAMAELEADVAPPVVFEEVTEGDGLPEPPMYVEERGGLLGRKHKVVYPTAPKGTGLGGPPSPHGAGWYEVPEEAPVRPRAGRNYERLPIVGSIYEDMERETSPVVGVAGRLRSIDEPTMDDAIGASAIASSAARELAEMARFEEGPDLEPEGDDASPRARRRTPSGGSPSTDAVGDLGDVDELAEPPPPPRAHGRAGHAPKSTARKVKHPTGALKSRGRKAAREAVLEEDGALVGVVEWDGSRDGDIEEEDLFNPRRLEDERDVEGVDDGGPEEGSDEWAEEERIAALVREREEWDRL